MSVDEQDLIKRLGIEATKKARANWTRREATISRRISSLAELVTPIAVSDTKVLLLEQLAETFGIYPDSDVEMVTTTFSHRDHIEVKLKVTTPQPRAMDDLYDYIAKLEAELAELRKHITPTNHPGDGSPALGGIRA